MRKVPKQRPPIRSNRIEKMRECIGCMVSHMFGFNFHLKRIEERKFNKFLLPSLIPNP